MKSVGFEPTTYLLLVIQNCPLTYVVNYPLTYVVTVRSAI